MSDSTIDTESAERFDPTTMHGKMIESEHLARYRWSTQFAAGRHVLDVACGTGYGSVMLSSAGAARVTGVDIDAAAIERARNAISDGIDLVVGDINELPFDAGSFDLVVCFETIEHVADPDRALDELRRVLAPDGLLAISSPNRGVYPAGNTYHLRELTAVELETALEERFGNVDIRRQHTWICSGILADKAFAASGDQPLGDVDVRKLADNEPGAEIYSLALASNTELPPDRGVIAINEPVELRTWDELWQRQRDAMAEMAHHSKEVSKFADGVNRRLAQVERENGQLRHALLQAESQLAQAEDLKADLGEMRAAATELRGIKADHDNILADRDNILADRDNILADRDSLLRQYVAVVDSRTWKLTAPVRHAIRALRSRGW